MGAVMSMSKLSAGDGYKYLVDQTVSADQSRAEGESMADYYTRSGCPDGRWVGSGISALGLEGTVTEEQMRALFGEGMHPDARAIITDRIAAGDSADKALKAARLGRPFYQFDGQDKRLDGAVRFEMRQARTQLGRDLTADEKHEAAARATDRFLSDRPVDGHGSKMRRPVRQPVAGYDDTFSVPKSFSVAWATGDEATRTMIEGWHEAAIAETLSYIEDHALFTRRGPDGIATLETGGLVAARFRHWDSRAGDPQLHDHVAIANRVQGSDGAWRTIDGAHLYKWKVAASETYNRALADAAHADGYATRLRDTGSHRQPVVELDGVTDRQIAAFSTRRGAITSRTEVLEEKYRLAHGHRPSRAVRYQLAQQATLETREPKKGPHRLDELQQQWADRLADRPTLVRLDDTGPAVVNTDEMASTIIGNVSAERATWERAHVEAAVNAWASQQPQSVTSEDRDRIIATALDRESVAITPTSAAPPVEVDKGQPADRQRFVRSDGESVYVKPHWTRYTSAKVMAAEDRLLDASRQLIVGAITPAALEAALAAAPEWFAADGRAFARQLATSDRLLSVGIGPAGTGKTTSAAVVADAAHRSGVQVIAVATASRTATDLGQGVDADHTTTFAGWLRGGYSPDLSAGDLIIIDEAGMSGTFDLDAVVAQAQGAGAQVIALGDDRQLGPVGAGGAMSLVAAETGAAQLSVAHRFEAADEATASLNLRDGDASWYISAGRVHGGDKDSVINNLVERWAIDRFTDVHDSLMIADTTGDVAALNAAAQSWLVDHDFLSSRQRTVDLADETTAGVGDLIVTRRNDRQLMASDGKTTVKNRMRWQIHEVGADGSLRVADAHGRQVTLPADYVAQHVELGYAVTNHGAQGLTVETAHYLTAASGDRSAAYPAMTRGRLSNDVWVGGSEDDQQAAEMLTTMVARAPQASSAHQAITAEWSRIDRPADLVRAARDMANSYDALRYAIALRQAGLKLGPGENRRAVYEVLRAGETAGISTGKLAGLAARDLPADQRGALDVAAVMAGHLAQITPPDPNRPLADLTDAQLARAATRAEQDLATARAKAAHLSSQLAADPRPATMTDGTLRPSWAERSWGRLSDDQLNRQIATTAGHADGIEQLAGQMRTELDDARAAFAAHNQPGQRRSPEAVAAAGRVEAAQHDLTTLARSAARVAQQRRGLEDEAKIRADMDPAARATEDMQRAAHDGQTTVEVIADRGAHLAGEEQAGPALDRATEIAAQTRAEQAARDHTPDLPVENRPRWDYYTPIATDPHLPDHHGATIREWQTFIDRRMQETGAAIALSDQKPAWTAELGRLPDATDEADLRQRWETLAGRVDAWRELSEWANPDRALPPPSQGATALPTAPERDLHTLRTAMSDLRRDINQQPERPDDRSWDVFAGKGTTPTIRPDETQTATATVTRTDVEAERRRTRAEDPREQRGHDQQRRPTQTEPERTRREDSSRTADRQPDRQRQEQQRRQADQRRDQDHGRGRGLTR